MQRPAITILILSLLSACSSVELKRAYSDSAHHKRSLFLALYPDLTEEQRKEFLSSNADPVTLLTEWKIGSPPILADPDRFAPTHLVVESAAVIPVKTGRTLPVQAFLEYPGGKRVEVTTDVTWKVGPDVAWMSSPGKLDYECLAGSVEINADFYGERAGRVAIPFAKSIKTLELGISESSQVIDTGEYIKLKLQAYCTDGTQADVACQASWKIPAELGRLRACGNLQIYSQQALTDGMAQATATYAGKTVTRQVRFKARDSR